MGFALRKGDIPSGSGIAVTGASAQVTVKNAWPDGSAKFAIVAGTAALTAGVATAVALSAGAASNGTALTTSDLQAALVQPVTVGCGSFGSASWSGSDWASPFETWVVGHRMSSWLYRKSVGSDSHLVAWLEVRLYAGGALEVLPWVENGYLMVTGPTSKNATYSFTLGGTLRFSQSIDIPHHCRTVLIGASSASGGAETAYWLGTAHDVIAVHDADYIQTTGLVPAYFAKTNPTSARVLAQPTTYKPLQQGSFPNGMGAGGYSPSIGLLPEWDVLHLTSANSVTYKSVIFNGFSAGRYATHYRDESNGHRPARLSLYPTMQIREPAQGYVTPPATSGTLPPNWTMSHHPSVGYFAYLISGRAYFRDEIQFLASFNSLSETAGARENSAGISKTTASGNERHTAWMWRTLVQAISATPDADTVAAGEFRAQLENNVSWYHGYYIGASNDAANPRIKSLGWVEPAVDYNSGLYLVNGVVSAGASTTVIQINPGGIDQDQTGPNQYIGWTCTNNTTKEARRVTSYNIVTNTLTVSPGFSTAPPAGTIILLDDSVYFTATWMQDFVTAAWGYTKDLGVGLTATRMQQMDRLFAWKAQSVVGRLGGSGATEYTYRDYAPYTVAISPSANPDWVGGTGPWFTDWGQVWSATYAGASVDDSNHKPPPYLAHGPRTDGDLRSNIAADLPGANALPAIAYCVKYGIAGAEAGYRRLTTASNWPQLVAALDIEPVWSVAPGVFPR